MNRSFDCKSEELPVVCRFGAISLERDLTDFTAYSPMFGAPYLAAFKAKIEVIQELVLPQSETVELKVITERIYQTLDDLISPINHLEGYLKLAGKTGTHLFCRFWSDAIAQKRAGARCGKCTETVAHRRRKHRQIQNSIDGQGAYRGADRKV